MTSSALDRRALILAPTGNDGPALAGLLVEAGIDAQALASMEDWCGELDRGAALGLIAAEALDADGHARLERALAGQPAWSRLPVVLITWHESGDRMPMQAAAEMLQPLATLVILERPFSRALLLLTARTALHGRQAQYQMRELNRRLEEQALLLQQSNRDLEHFAYVASHDMQEPLRMISSYLDLLSHRYGAQLDGEARRYIEFARSGAGRMSLMIRGLLDLAQAERAALAFVSFDLGEAVRDAVANLRLKIAETSAVVEIADLPRVTGDRPLLTQVLQNLVANALKFRAEDAPRVVISAATREGIPVIAVDDNGIGIEPQQYERIFGIFQRLHRPHEYPGSGIGLALCRSIVERHGGRIGVESVIGKGSRFWFSLGKEGAIAAKPSAG